MRLNINIVILSKVKYTGNAIPIKTPIQYFTELELVLKFTQRNKRPMIVQDNFTNSQGEIDSPRQQDLA